MQDNISVSSEDQEPERKRVRIDTEVSSHEESDCDKSLESSSEKIESNSSTTHTETIARECRICLDAIDESTRASLVCNHEFHLDCITNWTKDHNTCAYCRQVIDKIDHDFDEEGIARTSTVVAPAPPENEQSIYFVSARVTPGVFVSNLTRGSDLMSSNFELVNNSRVRDIVLVEVNGCETIVTHGTSHTLTEPHPSTTIRVGKRSVLLGPSLALLADMYATEVAHERDNPIDDE